MTLEEQRVVSARLRRSGRVRLSPRGHRAGDRGDVDPRRQADRAAARSRSPGRSSPTPRCCRRSSASTTTWAPAPDEVLLPIEIEDAALKAEWLTEQRAAQAAGGARSGRGAGAPARRSPQAGRAGATRTRPPASPPPQRARRHRAGAGQAAEAAQAAAAAARDRVLRRLAHPGLRDGGVDGGVRRRAARARRATAPTRSGRRRAAGAKRARTTTSRRCTRCCRGGSGGRARAGATRWKLPDLIVVDGGKGQLAMALAAARDVGIEVRPGRRAADRRAGEGARGEGAAAAPLASRGEAAAASHGRRAAPALRPSGRRGRATGQAPLASGAKDSAKRPDRVFLPHAKDAIPIRPNSAEMFVLQALRDEAHRFAVSFHRGQRRRLTLRSALADDPRHRARPPAPAAAALRQHQARSRGDGRRAGRGPRDDPARRRGRVRALGEAAARPRPSPGIRL